MGIHKPLSRDFFTIDGEVKKTGGSLGLAQGQFALVREDKPTAQGAQVIGDNMGALSPDASLTMRLGAFKVQNPTNGYTNKPYSSEIFKLDAIKSIKVFHPKQAVQEFDSWILGYNGINANTALTIPEQSSAPVEIIFKGDFLAATALDMCHIAKFHIYREEGEAMQTVIERLYKEILNYKFAGQIKLTDLADVKLVDSTAEALTGDEQVFWSVQVNDAGSAVDLARVQVDQPYPVKRTFRDGIVSTYTLVAPEGETPDDYAQVVSRGNIKGCEDCPAGYTTLTGGFLYSVSLEDDGVDSKATVQALPNAVALSAVKTRNDNGKGTYKVVLTAPLTQGQLDTFITANPTTEVENQGLISDLCTLTSSTDIAWVAGDSCFINEDLYRIQLADDNCEGNRLAELQASYPGMDISIVDDATSGSYAVTLTGTSGTANVSIGGVNYLATFTTNLTTSATNFVTSHQAALSALGIAVSSNAAVITISGEAEALGTPAVVNATGDLAGTVGAFDPANLAGGCQTVYEMVVPTDLQCEDCDPIFTTMFNSEAPAAFGGIEWKLFNPTTPSTSALMGIKITGKPFIFYPTNVTKDSMPFYETSPEIIIVGGQPEEINESYQPINLDSFAVKQISWKADRDNLGWDLLPREEASRVYFTGNYGHKNNLFTQQILGEASVLEFTAQYVGYEITIKDTKFSQGASHSSNIGTAYTIWSKVGQDGAIRSLVQALAGKVGLTVDQPTA